MTSPLSSPLPGLSFDEWGKIGWLEFRYTPSGSFVLTRFPPPRRVLISRDYRRQSEKNPNMFYRKVGGGKEIVTLRADNVTLVYGILQEFNADLMLDYCTLLKWEVLKDSE